MNQVCLLHGHFSPFPVLSLSSFWLLAPPGAEVNTIDRTADVPLSHTHSLSHHPRADRLGRVGAATETELRDKKLRYEDAINSVKSAIEMGVLPGGGTALVYIAQTLREEVLGAFDPEDKERRAGAEIMLRAMEQPIRQIAANSGFTPGRVLEEVKARGEWGWGLNAATGKYEDLLASGVLDSASVVLNAIANSASIASLVLTTECVISNRDPGMGGM